MGLSIAVFVPEGIVVGCDTQSRVVNSDEGYIQKHQQKLFSFAGRFLVNIIGDVFYKETPCGVFVERAFQILRDRVFDTTHDFAVSLDEKLVTMIGTEQQISFYVAGIDSSKEKVFEPTVFLVEHNNITQVNHGMDDKLVYNYHAVGCSVWIDKLILPTIAHMGETEDISLDEARIDFSKYSLENSIEFVHSMLKISNKMDEFTQIRPRVGDHFSIGVLSLNSQIKIVQHA